MYEIREVKKQLRQHYSEERKNLGADVRCRYDEAICISFCSLVSFRYSDILLIYYPIKTEIDTLKIIENALKQKKAVALPRCNTDSFTMEFHFIESLDDLEIGAYGIHEPKKSLPVYDCDDSRPAAMVIPALAYDKKGYRLGYGKGYYDRYLTRYKGSKIGFSYSNFITNRLPKGKNDKSVDLIVTEKGVSIIEKN